MEMKIIKMKAKQNNIRLSQIMAELIGNAAVNVAKINKKFTHEEYLELHSQLYLIESLEKVRMFIDEILEKE